MSGAYDDIPGGDRGVDEPMTDEVLAETIKLFMQLLDNQGQQAVMPMPVVLVLGLCKEVVAHRAAKKN